MLTLKKRSAYVVYDSCFVSHALEHNHLLLDSHSLRSIKMVAEEVGVLSDAELAKIAKDEVNEDPERLAEDLQAVKDWLEKQPHLQNVRKGKLF